MTELPGPRPFPELIAGRYRVVSKLGAGGMGLVFKAIDTRLDRAVAIKAIHDPRLLQADAARRLRTEALAAASLDHPYICKVYELLDEGEETYLVMELVEGETMASLLRRGTPPLAQTLQLSREIAEGLAAAHARGLVHRDIKPSNVIVTPHGHVKLLDFGLARTDMTTHASEATRTSPAATSAYAGTPFYMAPEQAAGQPITSRADLFSLGVVMFECLTGKLPFAGTSGYDYVRHLLSDDPRALFRLAPEAPADLVRLVERCLEKTPAARVESAAEIVVELQRLSDSLTRSATLVPTIGQARRRRTWFVASVAAGLAAAAGAAWFIWSRPAEVTSVLQSSRMLVSWPSDEFDSRISPDGQWVSFLSSRGGATELFVQRIDGGDPRGVTLSAGRPLSHVWSPDGRDLACVLVQGDRVALHVVPAFFGGAAKQQFTIEASSLRVRLLRWIGRAIYLQIGEPPQGLSRLDIDTGDVTLASASWKLDGVLRGGDVRPDGRAVTYVVSKDGRDDLWVADLDGANARRLTDDTFFERAPLWRGAGDTILFRSNRAGQVDLWEIDARSGRAWALTSSQTQEEPESSSIDGRTVTFRQSSEDSKLWIVDRTTGRSQQLTAGTLSDAAPTVSRDGARVIFQRTPPSPSQSVSMVDATLYVAERAGAGARQEPRAIGAGFAATIAPDGASVAYQQRHAHPTRMWLVVTALATGTTVTATEHAILPSFSPQPVEWVEQVFAWSPDSAELYFADYEARPTIRRFRPRAGEPPTVLAAAENGEFIRDLYPSADGRSLAFIVWKSKMAVVRLIDLTTGAVRELATFPTGGIYSRGWLPDDRGLLLLRTGARGDESGLSEVEILTLMKSGSVDAAGSIAQAYLGTTRYDSAKSVLYVTRSIDGIHNVHEYSLATKTLRQVTDNNVPGVTFSGMRPAPAGSNDILVVRDARVRDVWVGAVAPVGSTRR